MISLKSLLNETVIRDPNFIAYIKSVEGTKRNAAGDHRAYKDSVGKWTIGYGHTGNVKSNMTWKDAIADQYLIKDLTSAENRVLDFVNNKYPGSKLDSKQTQMLTDFAFNLGSLTKFPLFTKAVVTRNWKLAQKEYKRFADGKELTGRNNKFFKTFLEPLLNELPSIVSSTQKTPDIDVTYTSDNPPYADLLRNPPAALIASVLKQSLGTFNDYEAWAEAAFASIKTKLKYAQVSKILDQDAYEYVKSFMDTSIKYHKQPIDISYKSLT